MLLTLNKQEEKVIDKIISTIADYIKIEPMQVAPVSVLSFPGLEIRQSQHRVFQDGEEVSLTRLEYSTLALLASNPGIVLTQSRLFADWYGGWFYRFHPRTCVSAHRYKARSAPAPHRSAGCNKSRTHFCIPAAQS